MTDGAPATQRTHDGDIYLAEQDRPPKEAFVLSADAVEAALGSANDKTWLDVGCAAGALLSYVQRRFPDVAPVGLDVLPEFADAVTAAVPGAHFLLGSVMDQNAAPSGCADVVTAIGVMGIFEDYRRFIGNLLSWCRSGGIVIVYGLINPYPVDVFVTYRAAGARDASPRELGWNSFSEATLSAYLASRADVESWSYTPHRLGVDIPRNEDDPVRSWTIKDETGQRHVVNGLGLLEPLQFLTIRRK